MSKHDIIECSKYRTSERIPTLVFATKDYNDKVVTM